MWKLAGHKATLQVHELSCEFDLDSPANGLTNLSAVLNAGQSWTSVHAALMQLILPSGQPQLADAYVRGRDLIVTFSESANYPCRTQVYWRFEHASDFVGIQMIISVQTSQLDATPALMVTSRLPGAARAVQEGIVVVPLPASDICYAELTDASNIESTIVRDTRITNKLFPGALEKGVIRRARMLGCFLHGSSPQPLASSLHGRFARSAPPLTT